MNRNQNYWIAVSDIATLTDHNPYQDSDECLKKYKNRFFKNLPKSEIKEERIEKAVTKTLTSQDLEIRTYFNKVDVKNSNDVVKQLNELLVDVDRPEGVSKEQIKKYVKSEVYKTHGKKYETCVFDWLKTQLHGELAESQKGKGRNIGTVKSRQWRLYGKVDGIYTNPMGKKFIVEIKNRQNRIFDKIPLYEQIQIQTYMYIFNIKNAILVQHYVGEYTMDYVKCDGQFIKSIVFELKEALERIESV
jgi:hypothetical protein